MGRPSKIGLTLVPRGAGGSEKPRPSVELVESVEVDSAKSHSISSSNIANMTCERTSDIRQER